MQPQPSPQPQTPYDAIGGEPALRALVARFYAEVRRDDVLRGDADRGRRGGAEPYRRQLWDYFESTAAHMVNSPV
jgi:truncated hemoglobin YjbI